MTRSFLRLRLYGLLGALGFAAALISLAGFLGPFSWWLEILSHFRMQYAICFLILAGLYALGRKWKPMAGACAMALVNALPVLLFLLPPAPAAPAGGPAFRVMLLNVNSAWGDPVAVQAAISRARPDLLVLEEINDRWLANLAPALAAYPYREMQPRFDNFGIGLFSRHPLISARIVPFGLVDIPTIFAQVLLAGRPLNLIATHPMPPGEALLARERNRQLDWLAGEIAGLSGSVLLVGDLNAAPWSPVFGRFERTSGLIDSARGRSIHPTWPAFIPLLWIPLDHLLHSPDLAVRNYNVGAAVRSDHLPVIVDFTWPAPPGN